MPKKMTKTEEMQLKMNRLAELFGAKTGTKTGVRCSGKWAGTTDYSVTFDNGEHFFISNGMKAWDINFDKIFRTYNRFAEKKSEIIDILRTIEEQDRRTAEEQGLLSYHVIDVDYQKTGGYIGWFYVTIQLSDGRVTTMQETGLKYEIIDFILLDNSEQLKDMPERYRIAGGCTKPDFVFHGYGFDFGAYTMHD